MVEMKICEDLGNFLCPEDFSEILTSFFEINAIFVKISGVIFLRKGGFSKDLDAFSRSRCNFMNSSEFLIISYFLIVLTFLSFGRSPISTEDRRPPLTFTQLKSLSIIKNQNQPPLTTFTPLKTL